MPTQAIAAYGVELRLGDGVPGPGVGISGATNATPIVITAAHGIPVGDVDVMQISGVGGNTAANGTWIVQALTTTTLALRGSAGNGAYTTGGSAQRLDTYTVIAEVTNIEDSGMMATLVNVTAHDGNGYESQIPTFLRGNTMRLACNWVPAHPTHDALTGLTYLLTQRVTRHYMIVWPSKTATKPVWSFSAWVTQDRKAAPVAGALTTAAQFEIDGRMVFAA